MPRNAFFLPYDTPKCIWRLGFARTPCRGKQEGTGREGEGRECEESEEMCTDKPFNAKSCMHGVTLMLSVALTSENTHRH